MSPAVSTPEQSSRPGAAIDAAALRTALLELVRARGYERRDEPFTLSSGGTSRDYVDMRRAVARGSDLLLATEAVLAYLGENSIEFDAIGGMTMGADPIAHTAAVMSGRSWYSVRKAEKGHGARRRIEGANLTEGVRVIVFEDTVSTGSSLLEALDVVATTGAEVVHALTVLDRGEAARAAFAALAVPYHALLTYEDLGIDSLGGPAAPTTS